MRNLPDAVPDRNKYTPEYQIRKARAYMQGRFPNSTILFTKYGQRQFLMIPRKKQSNAIRHLFRNYAKVIICSVSLINVLYLYNGYIKDVNYLITPHTNQLFYFLCYFKGALWVKCVFVGIYSLQFFQMLYFLSQ